MDNIKKDQPLQNVHSHNTVRIAEAAEINGVTRQAIYVAIKQKKLKASKGGTRWEIGLKDLEEYRKQKYSKDKSLFNGELLFDKSKGLHSVKEVAKILNLSIQHIYYSIRVGLMKATQKSAAWVIHVDDIKSYQEKYLNTKHQMSRAV